MKLTLIRAGLAVMLTLSLIGSPIAEQQGPPVKAFTGIRLIGGSDRAPVANATINHFTDRFSI
jgi:hypothetical protein